MIGAFISSFTMSFAVHPQPKADANSRGPPALGTWLIIVSMAPGNRSIVPIPESTADIRNETRPVMKYFQFQGKSTPASIALFSAQR